MQKTVSIDFEEYDSINDLSSIDRDLLNIAIRSANNAYAPYSKFRVGASGLLKDGSVVAGANFENASYGATVCAERVLLANVMVNHTKNALTTISVSASNANGENDKPISCCGICRQTLLEYEVATNQSLRIIMGGASGKVIIVNSAKNLLPFAFSSSDL